MVVSVLRAPEAPGLLSPVGTGPGGGGRGPPGPVRPWPPAASFPALP